MFVVHEGKKSDKAEITLRELSSHFIEKIDCKSGIVWPNVKDFMRS